MSFIKNKGFVVNKNLFIPENFDEQTIYLAFIAYCKFNTDIPIPESIQHLCHNKPSIDVYNPSEDSIQKKIAKLKESGEYNYTPEALQALLQIVNKEHIIPFNFNLRACQCINKIVLIVIRGYFQKK